MSSLRVKIRINSVSGPTILFLLHSSLAAELAALRCSLHKVRFFSFSHDLIALDERVSLIKLTTDKCTYLNELRSGIGFFVIECVILKHICSSLLRAHHLHNTYERNSRDRMSLYQKCA